jgi:hypothetical protein
VPPDGRQPQTIHFQPTERLSDSFGETSIATGLAARLANKADVFAPA